MRNGCEKMERNNNYRDNNNQNRRVYSQNNNNQNRRAYSQNNNNQNRRAYSQNMNEREYAQSYAQTRKRKKYKRNYRLFYILLLLFTIAIGIILSLTVFFKVNNINIDGITRYEHDEIIHAAKISDNENLFMINSDNIKNIIMDELVYCDAVKIDKKFPSSLYITINESDVVFSVKDGKSYIYLSENGRILEIGQAKKSKGSILIKGINIDNPKQGKFISESKELSEIINSSEEDKPEANIHKNIISDNNLNENMMDNWYSKEKFIAVNQILETANDVKLKEIRAIDISRVTDIKLNYQNRFDLNIGSIDDITYKLERMKYLLTSGEIREEEKGVIYYVKRTDNNGSEFQVESK